LKDLVVCISKGLTQRQTELVTIASNLGADYRWVLDTNVTHYIHQGKPEKGKDFTFIDQHPKYVSPFLSFNCPGTEGGASAFLIQSFYLPRGTTLEPQIVPSSPIAGSAFHESHSLPYFFPIP
jgi:hypothetical protein